MEFGLIAPFLFALSLGTLEFALDICAKVVLSGAVQQAGRDAGLESAHSDQKEVDANVTKQIHAYLPQASVTFDRKNYENFSDVGTPEDFTDSNHNGNYDPTECFDDVNGNSVWDMDSGATGQGGARDVVVYTVSMEYDELLPIRSFFGFSKKRKFSATTTLMNQPFSTQKDRVAKEICPT